ncbi:MAG TPA: aspartate aminotransferase family protein [Anaerolineae bacterium]|nr:aspartate aminotransferase family protein [Anaerolineae bacterium]
MNPIELEQKYVVHAYNRPPIVLVDGQGVWLEDAEGNRYLDLVAGIAVSALGYGDPEIAETICQAGKKPLHFSNLYHNEPMAQLAAKLVDLTPFADRVHFQNSGTESTEAAIKFARKFARTHFGEGKTDIVAFTGAFHGRTMGALAMTPREKYQKPYEPLMPGVRFARFNDLESARETVDDHVCAIIVEPVQGEGGIHPAGVDFLVGLRELAWKHDALLIFDEVQCGVGRTGTFWAHEQMGVLPDILCAAKPLANGLPIGAVLVTERVAEVIHPGDHGTTFAGGPFVTSVAQVVVDRISAPAFLQHVQETGAYFKSRLEGLNHPHIQEVRGKGLMLGVQLDMPAAPVVEAGYRHGLLLLNAGADVLRLVPPLIITQEEVDIAIERLEATLADVG